MTIVKLPQGEGQQRQGICQGGFPRSKLDQLGIHPQARHPRRALNDLGDTGNWHRPQRHGLETDGQRLGRLQAAQKIGAQSHHPQEGQISSQGCADQAPKTAGLFLLHQAEHFFRLIDRNKNLGFGPSGRSA